MNSDTNVQVQQMSGSDNLSRNTIENEIHVNKPSSTSYKLSKLKQITREEVTYHADRTSCWIIISDKVYDVTDFLMEVTPLCLTLFSTILSRLRFDLSLLLVPINS